MPRRWRKKWLGYAIFWGILASLIFYLYASGEGEIRTSASYTPKEAQLYYQSLAFKNEAPATDKQTYGGALFHRVAENKRFTLWLDLQGGHILLRDIQQPDAVWSSLPSEGEQQMDETKGLWKSNMRSSILFSYLIGTDKNETLSNTVDHPVVVHWRGIDGGAGVSYEIADLGFTFYFEYTIDDLGLSVAMPELGIQEQRQNRLVSMEPLPFFGAAAQAAEGKEGYLLVPDGPGGLIRFNKPLAESSVPYNEPLFGSDLAVPDHSESTFQRSPVAFPTFGINRGGDGYLAIVEEGAFRSNVIAEPAGIHTSLNAAHIKFSVRRGYWQAIGQTRWEYDYEKMLSPEKLRIRYVTLDHSQSDYVGMAKAYRSFLMNTEKLAKLPASAESPPLYLDLLMAATEPTSFGSKTLVATTFKQAEQIVRKLRDDGVSSMNIGIEGWQRGGYPGKLPDRFPVESAIGGSEGFAALGEALRAMNVGMIVDDVYNVATDKFGSGFKPSKDAVRRMDRTAAESKPNDWFNPNAESQFYMSPRLIAGIADKALDGYGKLNATGVGVGGMGDVYSDFNTKRLYTRAETADIYRNTLSALKQRMGHVVAGTSQSYLLGSADHLLSFPAESNYDLLIDEQVPFYPIALHGLVTYSATAGNMRENPRIDYLRAIEYGALPYFTLTHEDPRLLKRTEYLSIFSSQFSVLENQIVEEYRAFEETDKGSWNVFIEDHRKIADQVYETIYENGRRVVVNYGDRAYEGEGWRVEAQNYAVIEKGGSE